MKRRRGMVGLAHGLAHGPARALGRCVLVWALAACGKAAAPEEAVGASATPASDTPSFSYDSLDPEPVSSQALRGRPAVLAFVSTYDLESQAQVDYLAAMAKNDGDKVAYVIVALEPPSNRELVQAFRHFVGDKFGVTFKAALGDAVTIAGAGPFGDVHVVPTVVVLAPSGRIAWRKTGLSKSEEIRGALAAAAAAAAADR